MLKPDARVALVVAALPLAFGLSKTARGVTEPLALPPGDARSSGAPDAGSLHWQPGDAVLGVPPGTQLRVQPRPSAIRINGVALQWRALASTLSPSQVAHELGVAWRAVEPAVASRLPMGEAPWLVLTRRVGNELQALQLRDDEGAGSQGYWSVLDPTQGASSRPRAPLPVPAGATIESTIEQLDPGVRSTQYLGHARQSADTLVQRLGRAALAAGWQAQLPGTGRAGFQAFARGDERLELQVLAAGDASSFVLNVHAAGHAAGHAVGTGAR